MKRISIIIFVFVFVGCKHTEQTKSKIKVPPPLPPGFSLKTNNSNIVKASSIKNTVKLSYVPTDFALTNIKTYQKTNVVLSWINGVPPFQPQSKPDVFSSWMDYGPSTMQRSITNPMPYAFTKGFFRIRGGPIQPDFSPPVVTLTAPLNGSTVSNNVAMTATATDDVGVTKVEFYLDGNVLLATDSIAPYSGLFDSTIVQNGTHFLSAKAYDASGKIGNSPFVIVNIANPVLFSGTCIWSKRFGGNSGKNQTRRDFIVSKRAAVNSSGEVALAGYFNGIVNTGGNDLTNAGMTDIFISKHTSVGTHVWSKRFGSIADDRAEAVVFDAASGDVIVIGEFLGNVNFDGIILSSSGIGGDIFVVRISPTGIVRWAKRIGSTNGDFGKGIAIDSMGNILICGSFEGTIDISGGSLISTGLADVFLAKLDGDGNHIWSRKISSIQSDNAGGLGIDLSDNVIVTGDVSGTTDFGFGPVAIGGGADVFIAKYNSAGSPIWANVYGDIESQRPVGLSVDSSGSIACSGIFLGKINFGTGTMTNMGNQDVFVTKLKPDGSCLWQKKIGYDDDTIPTWSATDVCHDGIGNVVVAGGVLIGASAADGFLQKFSTNGVVLWSKTVSSVGNDGVTAVYSSSDGNVVFSGYFYEAVDLGCGTMIPTGYIDGFISKLSR